MTELFDLDWLDLREPFDALARDEGLAARLLARLPARPRLLDLGAGTGSLFRWLAPRIGRAQAWTLVEADRDMVEAAFDTVADRAEAVGLRVTLPSRRTLLVHAPGGAWRVEALVADLADAPGNLPLREADAVVSSALSTWCRARGSSAWPRRCACPSTPRSAWTAGTASPRRTRATPSWRGRSGATSGATRGSAAPPWARRRRPRSWRLSGRGASRWKRRRATGSCAGEARRRPCPPGPPGRS